MTLMIGSGQSKLILLYSMLGNSAEALLECRKDAVRQIEGIEPKGIDELKALCKPHSGILISLQYVQTILAGSYPDIQMDLATNKAKKTDWLALKIMIGRSPQQFFQTCINILDKVGDDADLDQRIAQVAKMLEGGEWNANKVAACSIVCSRLFKWVEKVVRYWRLKKQ